MTSSDASNSARAAQHLAVGAHALFHLLRDIARLEGQALLDAFAVPTVDLVPHQIDRQHRAERGEQYGQADLPDRTVG